jgi:PKD domain-containing protein/FG-GAP repeat protein
MRQRLLAALAWFTCVSIFLLSVEAAAPLIQIDNPSPAADAAFGTGVAGIGDVNGDGAADFVSGAPGANRAFVISGDDRSLIRTLTDPEGATDLNFGFAVAGTGDITGDGVEDIAVGAPGPLGSFVPLPCNPSLGDVCPPAAWGRVFLFNGATGALIRKIVPATTSFLKFGFSLGDLGDVNGDGVRDLAVGSPVLQRFWGQVYAFSGATGAQLWMTQEPGAERQAIASLGEFIAPLADINADGRRDLIAAAPFFDNDPTMSGFALTGKVFVLSGANGAILREHLAAAPVDGGFYGGKVSSVGDQNADGAEDYLIGDRGHAAIELRSGSTGVVIRAIPSPVSDNDTELYSLARAGDRSGDGVEDFWVGAFVAGTAYLLDGLGAVLLQVPDPSTPTPGVNAFAIQLAALADINGDAKPEVLIAKPGETVSSFSNAGAVFLLTSNHPPDANAGPNQTVSAGADCLASVTLDGSASSDPDGNALTYSWTGAFGTASGVSPQVSLALGTHTVTLTVDDGNGGSDSDTVTITVVDTSGPAITDASATPAVLWPANHKLVPITVSVTAIDNCSAATCRIVSIVSNEPVNGTGDGDAAPDWTITGDLTASLRAERSGQGSGRVYSIVVECTDIYGNSSTATVTASVPKSLAE